MTYQFLCQATEMAVREVLQDLRRQLGRAIADKEALSTVEIALAEALNNIVEHACSQQPEAVIRIDMCLDAAQVFVQVQDPGRALPGLTIPGPRHPDLAVDMLDLPEDGFGWTLIHTLSDRLDYSRVNGTNRLKLWFPRSSAA